MMQTLAQFVTANDGKSRWSSCTGNQAAGMKPQCVDGVSLWAQNLGKGCFPRRGDAKDLLRVADPRMWRIVYNSARAVPPPGAIIVYGPHAGQDPPSGHTDIALPGCTTSVLVTFGENWSVRNRFARERRLGYAANHVIGWMIAR
jgi:hypothetical protein